MPRPATSAWLPCASAGAHGFARGRPAWRHRPPDATRQLAICAPEQRSLFYGFCQRRSPTRLRRSRLKKLAVDENALVKLLNRWREEAEIAVAFEAGRDGFWLARWLRARGIETHVIHAS